MNGLLVIDKPAGWTSHDVVARVRRIVGERSIGHLGTLDPMATGVLPLVLGKWTRLAQFYLDAEKTYEGTIRFGFATDTYDAEGEATSEGKAASFTDAELQVMVEGYRGAIRQMPPPFSAKKIKGVPAYRLARKKEEVELEPVEVTVHEFEVSAPVDGVSSFRARVSSGTYVRSLAHDLGQKLGCGAHLASLRRTTHAEFEVAKSVSLERLEELVAGGDIFQVLLPARQVLPQLPMVVANDEQLVKVRHGNAVNLMELSGAELIKVLRGNGELACIAKRVAGTLFQPKIVLVE
ncbi:MAG TPA: tRNA pseudouridine(55) synthase TruB [Terriglobales bacterium]|nr:tRNA pseudouridine(55) synthase TruB [Terriglobales bacterium]